MFQIEDTLLPTLRSDLQLNEAPPEPEGAPTWTIYDPIANKYYKIGWLEFECISRFGRCATVRELAALLKKETTLDPDEETVKALVIFLVYNNLVMATGEGSLAHLETQRARLDRPWWERALHSYLFFTIPLFKPQAFLEKTYPYIRFLFTRQFMVGVFLLLGYGLFLSAQRLDELVSTFMNYLSFEGVILFLASTFIIKFVHELGHAYMAVKYKVPVTVIGIAFIVMYPVLYTEATNAWKLKNRRERLNIAAGGLMADFALASVALLLWHMLSPGIMQSLCFMIAIVSLGASLVINLNPLMKFDGYYLFSDLVGVDNLQDRSFAFGKWRLRRAVWGWDDPTPEALPQEQQDFLTVFGYATWVYRFFLYLGIGLLVYHVFFPPLGLILMIIELGFFIGMPIWREVRGWIARFEDIRATRRGKAVIALLLLCFLMFFIPVNRSIEVPAVMHAGEYVRFYTPIPAKVEAVNVAQGDAVEAGALLYKLSAPDLEYNIDIVSKRLKNLEEIKMSGQASPELAKKRVTLDSEIDRARKELAGYREVKDQLEIRAPFSGIMKDVAPALKAGQWVSSNMLLGLLADNSSYIISGYVREQDVERLKEHKDGAFYAEFSPFIQYGVILTSVDQAVIHDLYWSELSSVHNGPIPSERDQQGRIRPLPRYTYYAAKFDLAATSEKNFPDFVARGAIRLEAAPQSLSKMLINKAISFFVRESGL